MKGNKKTTGTDYLLSGTNKDILLKSLEESEADNTIERPLIEE